MKNIENESAFATVEKERPNDAAQRRNLETIASAATRLALAPDALRARCRRSARRVGDTTLANLGGGIVAFKFGRSWRIRFPDP